MIYGPAEHDTCDMGMGGMKGQPAQPLTDGQYMLYYFSVSMWSWRGMVELGTLLRDYPCDKADFDKPQCKMGRRLSSNLLAEADKFKADIDAAIARSVVKFSPEAAKTYGADMFVPSAVVPDGKPPLIFQSMTQDTLSEYSNFRYYSEMLSSEALDNNTAVQLQSFRENNGGCLSGMTRYSDHLDDMPAIGYGKLASPCHTHIPPPLWHVDPDQCLPHECTLFQLKRPSLLTASENIFCSCTGTLPTIKVVGPSSRPNRKVYTKMQAIQTGVGR